MGSRDTYSKEKKFAFAKERKNDLLMYQRLSKEEWEDAWPTSDLQRKSISPVKRAEEFGIDITLLIENLRRSPTERLLRAQQAAASLYSLRQEMLRTQKQK